MGFFDSYFGSSTKYSKTEYPLSAEKIKELVSRYKVQSLDSTEELLVEEIVTARRRGDGKISLFQIYEVLTKLKNQNKISQVDRDGLMKVFGKTLK
ncbi:MAG: hypothetical protein HOA57_04080 [Candidatus Magasanikbacteria bacterium]|jgi:hypothetical protein|nr:hypothetical protein [Candidatus Magasanikbacteria bacterium]MBT4314644.1 hypothetical protein [Candidatus Magasanikbacteria bacterium]MBT4547065.1 hypothetical protein [Candidatus Magasanikbacteria bacterium]MBT6819525.1 hypothetical protein [Candidatus Magasanikbacteria bacterium]